MSLTITEVTTYAEIEALSSPVEGDTVIWRDLTLRYDATIGEFIPAFVYQRKRTNVLQVVGTESNAQLQAAGWTLTETGTGAISTDGEKVTLEASLADSDVATLESAALTKQSSSLTGGAAWYQGRFQVGAPRAGADADLINYLGWEDGSKAHRITLQMSSGNQDLNFIGGTMPVESASRLSGEFDLTTATGSEAFVVAIFTALDHVSTQNNADRIYVDGYLYTHSYHPLSSFPNTSDRLLRFGSTDGKIICRNVVCGNFHRMYSQVNHIYNYDELDTLSPTDGDTVVWNDLTLRYDGTVEDWVPAQVYGVTSNVVEIVGDNASPTGWTKYTSTNGTITTDGTYVSAGTSTFNGRGYLVHSHGQDSSKGAWVQGFFYVSFVRAFAWTNQDAASVKWQDDAEDRNYLLIRGDTANTAEENSGFNSGSGNIGTTTTHFEESFRDRENHLCIIWSGLTAGTGQSRYDLAYINGVLSAAYFGTGYAASANGPSGDSGNRTVIGQIDGFGPDAMVRMRNVISGTFTR